ncbi:MAG: hypothetical protein ACAI35_27580, partial [Candidatus Methylacidiphilales bacterium]
SPMQHLLIPPWRRIDPPSDIAHLLYGKTSFPITLYSLNPRTSTDENYKGCMTIQSSASFSLAPPRRRLFYKDRFHT